MTPMASPSVRVTMASALGRDPARENVAPVPGRPIKLSEGRPIRELLG